MSFNYAFVSLFSLYHFLVFKSSFDSKIGSVEVDILKRLKELTKDKKAFF